ncbi:hypothetical protein GQ600_14342 [Phytophthora cactorum]|nr:hypothetical protein GQ600_14342 [Phytophthora cactorum]
MGKCTAADTTVLYVPAGLAVLRLVNCNADGGVSVDPTYWLLRVLWVEDFSLVSRGYYVVVFESRWFIRGGEARTLCAGKGAGVYTRHTSDTYLERYMPQFASFRRHSVEMPVQMCILKLLLLLVFSVLRSPPPSMANQGMQGSIFFFVVCTGRGGFPIAVCPRLTWSFSSTGCWSPTEYSVGDLVLVITILYCCHIFEVCLVVLLCANGVRSALTVSTSVTSSLTFLNACFLVMIGSKGLHDFALINLHPQSAKAKGLCWPTNERMKEIIYYGSKVESWVKAIHIAQSTILASLLVIPSMRSCEDLKTALDQVELCYEEAVSCDHLLMGQLYEVSLYVHELYVEAVASSPFHRIGFPTKDMAELTGVLQRRKDRQLLLSTRTRRVLNKLNIARSWPRRARPYAPENTGWNRARIAVGVQKFLDAESDSHQSASVLAATDWKAVNSVFSLKCPDTNDSELLISVLAWSESLDLVRWCTIQDPSSVGISQEQYFSLKNARQYGIQGGIVSSEMQTAVSLFYKHCPSPPQIQSLSYQLAMHCEGFKAIVPANKNGFAVRMRLLMEIPRRSWRSVMAVVNA